MKERFETWLAPQNDERREVAPLRQLGWAFLLAWVFCVFYTDAAGGRTLVHIRFVAEAFGCALDWEPKDGRTETVYVTK